MRVHPNPWRGTGLDLRPLPLSDPGPVAALLARCPVHVETPLLDLAPLAAETGVARLFVKDERDRMGLGSFKALGAAHVVARDATQASLAGLTYAAASAGNHGLSVAAGARVFGANAVIFLAETVPHSFAARLEAEGAEVRRAGATYEDSMEAAEAEAKAHGWTLLADSSWPGYTDIPLRVMEGYLQLAAEAAAQLPEPPTHIYLQAGVGGLAAAVAAHARATWGDAPHITVVEPEAAACLAESIRAGCLTTVEGPVSAMGRLDCKTPSMIALAGLARDADAFATITESEAASATGTLAAHGFPTTPSGAAGLAAVFAQPPGPAARVLAILTEGPVA